MICPRVLGQGRPLLQDKVDGMDMGLLDTRTFDFGIVALKYVQNGGAGSHREPGPGRN